MQAAQSLTPAQMSGFLLAVAPVRPVFIWGPPGIGKSSLVEGFAAAVGMECVSLLGSQLAPEDIIGVPRIDDTPAGAVSRFCPPAQIARSQPFVLFLDELNACSQEVQKAFYSLINDRRVGEYRLPEGSVVIGAGNRAQDAAIVKPISSALINRMAHVALRAEVRDWLAWAGEAGIHESVSEYIRLRPDHLWSRPPKHEEPFSTPRSWHILSDAIAGHAPGEMDEERLRTLTAGLLTPAHAQQFTAFHRQRERRHDLNAIIRGEIGWPDDPTERDISGPAPPNWVRKSLAIF